MYFSYIGDGAGAPEVTTVFGYTFRLGGDAIDVKEPAVIRKLQGNKTFRMVYPEAPKPVISTAASDPSDAAVDPVMVREVPSEEPSTITVAEKKKKAVK